MAGIRMVGIRVVGLVRAADAGGARSGARRRWALRGGARPPLASYASLVVALLALVPLVLLAACGSASPTSDVANCPPLTPSAATATPPNSSLATATPSVLYQANWARVLDGWQATPGWSVVNGALESDTGQDRAITIPYQPPTSDYQVEFDVQILDIPRTGGQFALRTAPVGCAAGFDVGVIGLKVGRFRPNGDHPLSIVYLDPQAAQDTASLRNNTHDYEPGPGVRAYAVVVRGAQATFSVDGHYFGSANSALSAHLANSPIRLTCSGVSIRVTILRILTD